MYATFPIAQHFSLFLMTVSKSFKFKTKTVFKRSETVKNVHGTFMQTVRYVERLGTFVPECIKALEQIVGNV